MKTELKKVKLILTLVGVLGALVFLTGCPKQAQQNIEKVQSDVDQAVKNVEVKAKAAEDRLKDVESKSKEIE